MSKQGVTHLLYQLVWNGLRNSVASKLVTRATARAAVLVRRFGAGLVAIVGVVSRAGVSRA